MRLDSNGLPADREQLSETELALTRLLDEVYRLGLIKGSGHERTTMPQLRGQAMEILERERIAAQTPLRELLQELVAAYNAAWEEGCGQGYVSEAARERCRKALERAQATAESGWGGS